MTHRPPLLVRAAVVAPALLAAALAWLPYRHWRREQETLAVTLHAYAGALPVELGAEVRREPDPRRGELALARALLSAELDPRTAAAPKPAGMARLAAARAMAARDVAVRPAAWDAAMLLGATTYLSWAQAGDRRLFTAYHQWEAPLLAALALAPGKREPPRFLAAAYLELWPAVAPEKRAFARRLLRAGFRDPDTFAHLAGPWLDAAGSREAAFALVPPDPRAWELLQGLFAGRGDWQGATAAHERLRRVLRARLEADLRQGQERLSGGDVNGARALLLGVAARAEQGPRGADLLARALELCPPGPADGGTAGRLADQLAWIVDRCQVTACPLKEDALKRLTGLCRDLPLERQALADLAAGDLEDAERAERRAAAQWSEAWAPYLLAKARLLAERGRAADAADALRQVHRAWQQGPLWWRARRDVARAASDSPAETEAERTLAHLAAADWPATDWMWHRGRARLTLLADRPAAGLRIAVDEAPAGGGWVELRLDGGIAGRFPAATGAELALNAPLTAGLHFLDLQTVAGGAVLPGDVRLAR